MDEFDKLQKFVSLQDALKIQKEAANLEKEKIKAQELKLQHIQQMLMNQLQAPNKSFMLQSDPKQEAEIALHDLATAIDEIIFWGQNAKDPMGNFINDNLLSAVKEKYNRLKWLMLGVYSSGGLRNGSLSSLGAAVGKL